MTVLLPDRLAQLREFGQDLFDARIVRGDRPSLAEIAGCTRENHVRDRRLAAARCGCDVVEVEDPAFGVEELLDA